MKTPVIASSQTPIRASLDENQPTGEDTDSESEKYPIEIQLEGEEIAATAPEGVDLAAVPQTGRALVEYSLECSPDGGECKIILGKICFAGGSEVGETEDGGGEIEEDGGEARPGFTLGGKGIAALLAKSVERNRG